MKKYHPRNERIKWNYLRHLKEAEGKADATINSVRTSIIRFERYTTFKDFATFNKEQAIGFKKHLANKTAARTKQPLSRATILTTLNNLKAFFIWLSYQPGYKSRLHVPDIDYFNLSEKEIRSAKAPKFRSFPTLEQVRTVIDVMPTATDIEKRNQALIAFTILTGMRDSAIASLRLKHVSIEQNLVMQHPSEVNTKFSKRIDTYFFPIGEEIEKIVIDWITFLKTEKLFGNDDPLFPRTKLGQDENHSFAALGFEPVNWNTTSSIRKIFKDAFEAASLPYFSPHTFRRTLVQLGEQICKTPEEFKAWSQNLGHESTLTTFNSYGTIATHRQGDLIRQLGENDEREDKIDMILKRLEERK